MSPIPTAGNRPLAARRCLVTGGNGFIGMHVVRLLASQGLEVHVFDRTSPPAWFEQADNIHFTRGDLRQLLASHSSLQDIEVVYHLAWAHVPESATRHPVGDIEENLVTTVRLLQACVEHGVKRLVFPSTGGAIYGTVQQLPVPESHPNHPISAYGVTKLAAEKYIELYYHLHGLEYTILRPSVPYGPGQDPFGQQGAVAVFMGKILTGRPITVWGDEALIVRDFFHVQDLARACLLAFDPPSPAGIYNIGGGHAISLKQLIAAISDVVGADYPMTIQRQAARSFDVPQLVLDIRLAALHLNWQPQVKLEAGLASTWRWYRDVWYPATLENR